MTMLDEAQGPQSANAAEGPAPAPVAPPTPAPAPTDALPPGAVGPISPAEAAGRPASSPIAPLTPGRIAKRISGLSQLQPWLPPDALVALARAPVPDAQLMSIGDSMRSAYQSVDKAIHWYHDDPVLAKKPSALLTLHRYLTSSIGPWPIEDAHLTSIQAGLQKAGFGAGLPVNGVWDSGWNAAWDAWSSRQTSQALSGKQVGGTTTGGALNHLLGSFLPTSAANAIGGFADGLVHLGRQALADVGGAAVGLATGGVAVTSHLLTRGEVGNVGGVGSAAAHYQQEFGHLLAPWDPIYGSEESLVHGLTYRTALGKGTSAGLTLSTAGDVFKGMAAIHSAMAAGSDVATANGVRNLTGRALQGFAAKGPGRSGELADLGLAAAQRGPGVVASTLGRVADVGNAFRNVPALSRVGPWVAKLNDADGLYYRARTLLATPNAFMPVRAAGAALGQATYLGAKLRGEAAASNLVAGTQTPLGQAVEGFHGADAVNDAVKNRLAFTAFGHHVELGLNSLPFLLHIPTEAGLGISDTIGSDVSGATGAVMHALGPSTSIAAQIERGTGTPLAKLIKDAGGEDRFARFWTNQVYQHAAAHYAEVEMSRLPADERPVDQQAWLEMHQALEHQAYAELADGNPRTLNAAIAEMLANDQGGVSYQMGGPNELSKRIARSMDSTRRGFKADQTHDVKDFLAASDHMENSVLPNADKLVHPGSGDAVNPEPGQLGIARLDTLDAAQGAAQTANFQARYDAAQAVLDKASRDQKLTNASPTTTADLEAASKARDDLTTLAHDVSAFMVTELGIDARRIPGDLRYRIQQADEFVHKNLAGPVRLAPGGPPVVRATPALQALNPADFGTARTASHWAHTFYRETDPAAAWRILHPEGRGPAGALPEYFANHPDLARGQGDNHGVLIEVDPPHSETAPDLSKPNAQFVAEHSGQAEFRIRPDIGKETISPAVRKVTIRAGVAEASKRQVGNITTDPVGNIETLLAHANYHRVENPDGSVTFVRPDWVRQQTGAPQSLIDAESAIRDLGYKLVYGKDIGWMHAPQTPLEVMAAPLTRRRKLIESIGLSPENVPTADLSFAKYRGQRNAIQKLVDKGQIHLPPFMTVDSLLHHLWNEQAIDLAPDALTRMVNAGLGRVTKTGRVNELIPSIIDAGRATNEADARKLAIGDLESELTRAMGLENVGRAKVVKALTAPVSETSPVPDAVKEELARLGQPSLLTTEEANRLYRAMVIGSADVPTYILGASKLDQLARTILPRMGFLGKVGPSFKSMAGTPGDMLANLPNELLTLRNRLRFQLSPEFSFRRVTKANVKLWLDGVPATAMPYHSMKAAGTLNHDLGVLDRVMPELSNPQYDQGAEALYSNDAFGFYAHRNWEAYAAGHWARQGKTDAQIRQLLIKNFGYGSKAFGEGRSAAERTVNWIFFPFSFDKTLYRNVGGYLLDHPARMMMLTGALNAYQAFSQAHPDSWGSSVWLEKHLPVLAEAQRLNAFEHGVSMGQFGGINAPLLNAFLPQKWDTNKHALSTIGSFAPAVKEVGDAYQEFASQAGVVRYAVGNKLAHAVGSQQNFTVANGTKESGEAFVSALKALAKAPYQPAESTQAQLSDAYAFRRTLMTDLGSYISANATRSKANKLTLPEGFGNYSGQVVDSHLIDELVQARYPAYNAQSAAGFSEQQQVAQDQFLQGLPASDPHTAYIRQWVSVANQVGLATYEGKYDPADAANNTQIIRNAAVWLAERDPRFYSAYNRFFRWQFGPLTEVKG